MTRAQRGLLVALAALALVVAFVALRTRKPPFLPADATHQSFESATTCLECHGPDGAVPRSKNHPLGNECMRCHAAR